MTAPGLSDQQSTPDQTASPPSPTGAASPSGLLLVDKPTGMTSHDVVARTRRYAHTRKVGHAGTLDPMATGLLILGIGSSTRLLTYLVGADKEYTATIRLGSATTTDDAEGEVTSVAPGGAAASLTEAELAAGIAELTGDIEQVPSSVSAIKVDGKRAYARVRAGEDVALAPRKVRVSAFEVLSTTESDGFLDVAVRVECSSGTYIRAIARDLGRLLAVGGHLTALRRTRVGPFSLAEASELDGLDVSAHLIVPADAARTLFDVLQLSTSQAVELSQGKRFPVPGVSTDPGPIAAIAPDGRLVGLVEYRGGVARTLVNFPTDPVRSAEPAEGSIG